MHQKCCLSVHQSLLFEELYVLFAKISYWNCIYSNFVCTCEIFNVNQWKSWFFLTILTSTPSPFFLQSVFHKRSLQLHFLFYRVNHAKERIPCPYLACVWSAASIQILAVNIQRHVTIFPFLVSRFVFWTKGVKNTCFWMFDFRYYNLNC